MDAELGVLLPLGSGDGSFRDEVSLAENLTKSITTPKTPTNKIALATSSHGTMLRLPDSTVAVSTFGRFSGGTAGAGAWIVDCRGGREPLGALSLNNSVGGGVVVRGGAMPGVCPGSYGADRTAPSTRQNASVSSGYVRLQVGQLFIEF